MSKLKYSMAIILISAYFALHGVLYILGTFLKDIFGLWNNFFTFLFGNITIISMPFVPIVLGVIYIAVAICLLLGMHWARITMLLLCVQAIFFEFPIGTIISLVIIIFFFTPSFSKMFSSKTKNTSYNIGGIAVVVIGLVAILTISGISSGVIKFTAYQFRTFEVSSATAESKISSITQRVGNINVILELTGSQDYALEQQDIVLEEIAPYIKSVIHRLSEVSNSLIINMEASKLDELAENKYIENIYSEQPSFMIAPYELSEATPENVVPTQLDVENLWNQGITGKGITIAVMDTGIKEDHPDLQRDGKSVVVGGLHLHGEYVYEHGTMVASCIANQNPDFRGIAPDVNILNIEVFSWQTVGGARYLTATNADILQGFEFVANWKKLTGDYVILSCSWGVSSQAFSHDADITIAAANRLATEFNIPIIAAAGNSGPGARSGYISIPFQVMSPAGGKNVLSVGAVDNNNAIASFSSRGPYYDGLNKPDVVAPGVNVPVLDYNGITTASGTSFACPYVSGVAALLVQQNNDLSSEQLYDALRNGATDLGTQGYDLEYGYGIVNAEQSSSVIQQTISQTNTILLFVAIIIIGIVIVAYPYLNKRLRR